MYTVTLFALFNHILKYHSASLSAMSLQINQFVLVKDEPGIVRYIGETEFAPGVWIGIELHKGTGKNDGSVNGKRYFECQKSGNYGIFVRRGMVKEESRPSLASDDSTLHKIIDKLQLKLRLATEDIRLFKEHAKTLQDTLTETESKIEMIEVDKHFLLESKNDLQQKLADLQLKYDELTTDYQLIFEESELNKQIELEIESQFSATQYSLSDVQAILLRNRKLEIALVNLQKFTDDSELSLKKEIDNLNAKVAESQSGIDGFAEVSKKLAAAESAIESLQSQLESTLDLERIIEHLHSENNELVNEVEKLKRAVEELTELHELDKSLEESQALVEADLKKNLQSLQDVIRKDKASIDELLRKNKYMESKLKGITIEVKPTEEPANESKLVALQLQLRKFKSSSHVTSIDAKLLQGQIELLQQRLALQSPPTHLSAQLEIVYRLKIIISNSALMNNELQLSLQYDNKLLTGYLNCVLTLWEHNYNSSHYTSIGERFLSLVSILDSNYNLLIDLVKEHHIFDPLFIEKFICDSTKLLLLADIVLQNRCYFIFLVRWIYQTCQVSSMIINEIRMRLTDNDLLDLFATLSQQCMEIELNTNLLTLSETHDLRFKVPFDILTLIQEVSQPIAILRETLSKVEAGKELDPQADRLSDTFKGFHTFINQEYENVPVATTLIYDALKSSTSMQIAHEPEDESNKFAELSARLLEKDRQLDDFQLNVQMLEDNMKLFNQMHSELMKQLKKELNETKVQLEIAKKNFQLVMEDKEALESQIQDLIKTNKIFADEDLLGKFDDVKSENQFTERIALIEEIFVLKRLALLNFDKSATRNSYKWLEDLIIIKPQVKQQPVRFQQCSESLRRLALDAKAIRLDTKPAWQPKASLPKYVQLSLHEQAKNYETARDSLLRDIL